MSTNPSSSRTPSDPIRPTGDVPDSQDDKKHSPDFEPLLDEAQTATPPLANPAPPKIAIHSDSLGETPPTTALPLPSTAAHTLFITNSSLPPTTDTQPPSPTLPTHPATPPNPDSHRLRTQIATLQSQIAALQAELSLTNSKLADPSRADGMVKAHIKLLHEYNAIKDVGLGLMGLIADGRGVRLGGVMEEFGVGTRD